MSKQKKAGILSLGAGKCLSYALTLMLTLAAFLLPSSAMADVAWVEYDDDNSTLTFKYGAEKPSDGTVTVYDLNEGDNHPGWYKDIYESVVFDKSFSSARPTSCYEWFSSQTCLTSIEGLEYLNTEKVTNMGYMFYYCSVLKSLDLSTFNTKNVTDMTSMFEECSKLTTIFASDKFSTAKVTTSDGMFNGCTSLAGAATYDEGNKDIDMANTDGYFSKKEAWAEYDRDKSTLTFKCGKKPSDSETVTVYDLNEGDDDPGWYIENSTSVKSVVFDESFSSARPTTCYGWFYEQSSLTSITGLKYLNTEKVTDMTSMFCGCNHLQSLDLSNFNTTNVTSMDYMFSYCSDLKSLDVSTFNTENVMSMNNMFECINLKELDLSSFNTTNVEMMASMFIYCIALEKLDLSSFNTANVTDMTSMFEGCSKLTAIYASDKFSTAKVYNSNDMFSNCTALVGAVKYNEDNIDASMANYNTGYFSQKKAWAEFNSSTQTLTFKTGTDIPESEGTVTAYELNEGENSPEWNDNTYTTVVFDKSFSSARPTTCYEWFYEQSSLTSITGLEYLNTEKVTDIGYMFSDCPSLGNLDVSNFNTDNVTNMDCMFNGCEKLTTLDLSNFNTTNVTHMDFMFSNCSELKDLNLTSFNTEEVTNMQDMFNGCEALEILDISTFNTAKVTNMDYMFANCPSLTTIYASDKFDVSNVNSSSNMFAYCSEQLVGAVGYNASNTNDGTMANYKTGYFKTYYKVGETKTELCGEDLSVDNLTLEGDKDLVVNAPFTATNVSYSRPMTSKWGTLCVPFEVDASSATGTKFYKLESVNYEMITLTKLEGKIAAGTPMLVNSTDGDGNAANISISAESVTVGATPADGTQAGGWQLVGSFAETEVPDDGYIISKNKFWLVSDLKEKVSGTKSVKTKAMRAWLKPSAESAEAKAHVLSIALDDENETTAVDAIEALTEDTAEIYDLQGRRLDSLQKGLNIVKTGNVTRKVMVK